MISLSTYTLFCGLHHQLHPERPFDRPRTGLGQTASAIVNDGVAKSVAYTLDAAGQIVRRKKTRNSNTGQAAPVEVFYRFAGKTMGMVGNNGTGDFSYDASVMGRGRSPTTLWPMTPLPSLPMAGILIFRAI